MQTLDTLEATLKRTARHFRAIRGWITRRRNADRDKRMHWRLARELGQVHPLADERDF